MLQSKNLKDKTNFHWDGVAIDELIKYYGLPFRSRVFTSLSHGGFWNRRRFSMTDLQLFYDGIGYFLLKRDKYKESNWKVAEAFFDPRVTKEFFETQHADFKLDVLYSSGSQLPQNIKKHFYEKMMTHDILDHVAERLAQPYLGLHEYEADGLAWAAKLMEKSGDSRYRKELMNALENTGNKKFKQHLKVAIKSMSGEVDKSYVKGSLFGGEQSVA